MPLSILNSASEQAFPALSYLSFFSKYKKVFDTDFSKKYLMLVQNYSKGICFDFINQYMKTDANIFLWFTLQSVSKQHAILGFPYQPDPTLIKAPYKLCKILT